MTFTKLFHHIPKQNTYTRTQKIPNDVVCLFFKPYVTVTQRMLNTSLQQSVYRFVQSIPKGKVSTYGDVALALELGTPRIVGRYLHLNPSSDKTPCHRVVHADGSLAPAFAFGGYLAQRSLLEKEGVTFLSNGKVDLQKSRWTRGMKAD